MSRVWEEGLCLRTQVESFRDETWSFWRARRRCLRRKGVREVDKVWSFSQWDSKWTEESVLVATLIRRTTASSE